MNQGTPSEPISILLMGVDERKNDQGRSDTLIVMTLNPEKEKMQMVSIPRDTRTEIVGHGTTDKINHAYASVVQRWRLRPLKTLPIFRSIIILK